MCRTPSVKRGVVSAQFDQRIYKCTVRRFNRQDTFPRLLTATGKPILPCIRGGVWYLQRSTAGFTGYLLRGLPTTFRMPADFDGDGKAELAVWRPSNGVWYGTTWAGNAFTGYRDSAQQMITGDRDYDGDGKLIAVYRPSTEPGICKVNCRIQRSRSVISSDRPVAADYDGDGKTDVAVYRPSNGAW